MSNYFLPIILILIIIYGNKKVKKESLIFLIKLGIGWIIGMILATLILASLFERNIYEISSLFLGFIIFSILYHFLY